MTPSTAAPTGTCWCWPATATPRRHRAGGTKLSRVENHRLAGILADGRLRDFAELELYHLAIYCRGETTRWGGDTVTLRRRTVRW